MEITEIISELKTKFGDKVDVAKITEMFKGVDTSKFSMSEIVDKVKNAGFLGDLDGDGVQEGFFDELKGKFGSMFGKK